MKNPQANILLLPVAGTAVFAGLYIVAAQLYPGGSHADASHDGFDWVNNYWCDLIAATSRNGLPNPGRPVAMTAMFVLFASLAVYWLRLPVFFREPDPGRTWLGYTGAVAMLLLVFVFTHYHDAVIFTGGLLSGIPFIGALRELFVHRWRALFLLGCWCMALILFNFFVYVSGWLDWILPLIQKIALFFFLLWVVLVSLSCRATNLRMQRKTPAQANGKSQLTA